MEWLILSLLITGVVIFLVSFMATDKDKKMKEVEDASLKAMGELYQLKQRIKFLEEELLSVKPASSSTMHTASNHLLEKEAYDLFQKGMNPEEIATEMKLNIDEVRYLLTKLQ